MRDYKKLEVWKKSHVLTKQMYKDILPLMPIEERFALTSQLRRSTYSIPLNIVEGCGKNTNKDGTQDGDNALAATLEAEYTCFLIFDLEYINHSKYEAINSSINEVKAMLISFINFLRNEK